MNVEISNLSDREKALFVCMFFARLKTSDEANRKYKEYMEILSNRYDINLRTLRNYRDAFDSYFENNDRKGWSGKLTHQQMYIFKSFKNMDIKTHEEKVKEIVFESDIEGGVDNSLTKMTEGLHISVNSIKIKAMDIHKAIRNKWTHGVKENCCIFIGNPGTGKLTTARYLGETLKNGGFLSSGHIICVKAEDVISTYIGQTAIKSMDIYREAKGGILYLDVESFKNNYNNDFLQEAIDVLCEFLTEIVTDVLVILAGRKDDIKSFVELNPGVDNRFMTRFTFPDISDDELLVFTIEELQKKHYSFDKLAIDALKRKINTLRSMMTQGFSNLHLVNEIVDKITRETAKSNFNMGAENCRIITEKEIDNICISVKETEAENQEDEYRPLSAYEGTEKFVFISYAHKDSDGVFPIIRRLQDDGFRIWYDDGIEPGNEWDEAIAEHIQRASFMLAFISNNYIESDNCKDELKFARDEDVERILIYLEDAELPPGIKMRLGRQQAIHYFRYTDKESFYEKLYNVAELKNLKCENKEALPHVKIEQSIQEKEFLLNNHPNFKILSYTIPQMCSYDDENLNGITEFFCDQINLEKLKIDDETYLGFYMTLEFEDLGNNTQQLYIAFEEFVQIMNDECDIVFNTPDVYLPASKNNAGKYEITLSFVCRMLECDDDMLEDIMSCFENKSPMFLFNFIVSNGYVNERFELSGTVCFAKSEMHNKMLADDFIKKDIHYEMCEEEFNKRIID